MQYRDKNLKDHMNEAPQFQQFLGYMYYQQQEVILVFETVVSMI